MVYAGEMQLRIRRAEMISKQILAWCIGFSAV
jgi:hypothetical protein